MPTNLKELEDRLWNAADQLRANSHLKSSEYATPVLGLLFLRFADVKFAQVDLTLKKKKASGRRGITKADYQALSVLYLPEKSRWDYLLNLPAKEDIGKAINDAMTFIEVDNEDLKGVLPKTYNAFDKPLLVELIKSFNNIPMDIEGDAFGKIYEYFLGKFAMSEGQKGGEFFTPTSIVKLIVEIIQPFEGKIFDPACGSGGMFVQSADFIARHKGGTLSVYGQERVEETVRLCKMNLAVHGLGGSVIQGNSYYTDPFEAVGKFDYVMANPPFNVDGVNKEDIKSRTDRFPFGMPKNDNGNYLWIQLFYSSLARKGRAGFVMANSASDARQSEMEIRRQLIQEHAVDVMVAVGSNMFYTVTLPVTLWFFDKGKKKTDRKDKILFIDARNLFNQIDRAHREWTQEQIDLLAGIARLYRGDDLNGYKFNGGGDVAGGGVAGRDVALQRLYPAQLDILKSAFSKKKYQDVAGLCRVATLAEVEAQGWSLNPGRYVGVAEQTKDDGDFAEQLSKLNSELQMLNIEAHKLEKYIAVNMAKFIKG